ncbi:MAG: DUF4268 domain-containing protein [Pyrinomonadaceae bacterium]|nr:DUF4268 domain-containing protein [Pyrinomonadaceae bacterium]
MSTVGKIQRVPLREVWKHEAYHFTRWLQENIDVLNDVTGLSLSTAEREQAAGDFSVDLVVEDDAGNTAIIENQLEKSNHDHLGKVITYLVALQAKTAIWIVSDPRPEHIGAISWLNESYAASFYLVKIEAIKIGESPAAPLLTLIVGPSDETKEAGKAKQEIAGRYVERRRFWSGLLEHAKTRTKLHSNISPGQYSWIGTGAGKQGLGFNYFIRRHDTGAELYIDKGEGSEQENIQIFDFLARHKEEIEKAFGGSLMWESLEGRRACRIRQLITIGGYRDEDKWPEIQAQMVDVMVRLERALKLHIAQLKI